MPLSFFLSHSSQFREILSNDKQKRLRAKNQWLVMYKRLIKTLTKYVPMAIKDTKRAEMYLQTGRMFKLFVRENIKVKRNASFLDYVSF